VPLSMCNWRDSVDDTRGCLWTPSQAEPNQYSRSYWGPAVKRWTLREVSMYGGTPTGFWNWFSVLGQAKP
jgi:hypothetical protein